MRIRPASIADIPAIAELAAKAWWAVYPAMLSDAQIRYSLEFMYAPETLRRNIEMREQPILALFQDKKLAGFAAHQIKHAEEAIHKLAKLYLDPEQKGQGMGRALVRAVEETVLQEGARALDLNVNKNNPAHRFYQRIGFSLLHEEIVPIGPYVMDDYVMRKIL